jgi:hypothetical protein
MIPKGVYGSSKYAISSLVSLTFTLSDEASSLAVRKVSSSERTIPHTNNILQIIQTGRPDNGSSNRILSQNPGNRNLGHRDSFLLGNFFHSIYNCAAHFATETAFQEAVIYKKRV